MDELETNNHCKFAVAKSNLDCKYISATLYLCLVYVISILYLKFIFLNLREGISAHERLTIM